MTVRLVSSEPKAIVIIGGGIVGVSIAYFLTRHSCYDPKIHSIVLLEASGIAGGSSGKAGGLLADWATPKCLAPLSFEAHAVLAKRHGGEKVWGYRRVHCAEVDLQAQESVGRAGKSVTRSVTANGPAPSELDWLLPDSVKSYEEVGNTKNSAQVNPYMFTTSLVKLVEEKGAGIIIGTATKINYKDDKRRVSSVNYKENGITKTLHATDVVIAAGPWTPQIFSKVKLRTPRGHSVVVRPAGSLSPYVIFANIKSASDSGHNDVFSPEIYPRPGDSLYSFDTVYAAGPDDYDVPLPTNSDSVEVDEWSCDKVRDAVASVSQKIHDGDLITKQACYKAQIKPHEDGEEVGPIVGPTGIKGLWLATGLDEWGIQNGPGTGLVMSEMIFEGAARSADCKSLDPRLFMDSAEPVLGHRDSH